MSIISKIIAEAIDDKAPIAGLLRKCLVLAHELKNEKLKAWVSGELYGFTEEALAPAYRTFGVASVGDFVAPYTTMSDQPLPVTVLKWDWAREYARSVTVNDSIAAIQSLIDTNNMNFALPWSADLVAAHAESFFDDFTLLRAKRVVPRSRLVQIIDTVRNKVLEFALELKDEVGESDDSLASIPREHVEQFVTQNFYGDNNVVGSVVHGDNAQASRGGVVQGDFASLGAALLAQNVPPTEIAGLKVALASDAEAQAGSGDIGPAATSWITRVGASIAAAGKGVAVQIVERGLVALVRAYLGI